MRIIQASGSQPPPAGLEDACNGHRDEAAPIFLQDGAPEGTLLGRSRFQGQSQTRDIAWVQAGLGSRELLEALGEAFSPGLSSAVARELSLVPGSAAPLASKTIERAIGVAQASWTALAGVDFLTLLRFSAVHSGPGFKTAAQELGLDPSVLSEGTRQALDARMKANFEKAAATGLVPVDQADTNEMVKKELMLLTK